MPPLSDRQLRALAHAKVRDDMDDPDFAAAIHAEGVRPEDVEEDLLREELEHLQEKYGNARSQPVASAFAVAPASSPAETFQDAFGLKVTYSAPKPMPKTRDAQVVAVLEDAGRPLTRREVWEEMVRRGWAEPVDEPAKHLGAAVNKLKYERRAVEVGDKKPLQVALKEHVTDDFGRPLNQNAKAGAPAGWDAG